MNDFAYYRRERRDYDSGKWIWSHSFGVRVGSDAQARAEEDVARGEGFHGTSEMIAGEWTAAERARGLNMRDAFTRTVRANMEGEES